MTRSTIVALAASAVGLMLTILVCVVLAPLVSGLAFPGCKSGPIKHGVSFLLAPGTNLLTGAPVTSQDLQRAVEALHRRADRLGCRFAVSNAGTAIRVVLSLTNDTDVAVARSVLIRNGLLEFRLVHDDSAKLVQEDMIPVGYTLMKETRTNPTGTKEVIPHLVSRRRLEDLSHWNIAQASVARGPMNDPRILFRFDAEGTAAFSRITSENIGKQLAVILDGELYSAPMIRTPITQGSAEISGGTMTERDAQQLASIMQSPLEVSVEVIEERRF